MWRLACAEIRLDTGRYLLIQHSCRLGYPSRMQKPSDALIRSRLDQARGAFSEHTKLLPAWAQAPSYMHSVFSLSGRRSNQLKSMDGFLFPPRCERKALAQGAGRAGDQGGEGNRGAENAGDVLRPAGRNQTCLAGIALIASRVDQVQTDDQDRRQHHIATLVE